MKTCRKILKLSNLIGTKSAGEYSCVRVFDFGSIPAFFFTFLSVFSLFLSLVTLSSCSNEDDKTKIKDFKNSLIDFVEGRDDGGLYKYFPENLSNFRITVDSGKRVLVPQSFEELQESVEEISEELSGDITSVIHLNETELAGGVTITLTVKVVDGSMERIVPVKASLIKDSKSGKLVLSSLDLFN